VMMVLAARPGVRSVLLVVLLAVGCWIVSGETDGVPGHTTENCLLTGRPPAINQKELRNCNRYLPQKSCCASIHDGEISEHLEHTIDTGQGCMRIALDRMPPVFAQFFCMACDPYQVSNAEFTRPWLKLFNDTTIERSYGGVNRAAASMAVKGTIYLCEDFARGLLPPKADSTTGVVNTDGISIYDACGFSMYTNDHGVVLWGDIDPTTGDDPIIPGQIWDVKDFPAGTLSMLNGAYDEDSLMFLRPPFLENYNFSIVNVSLCNNALDSSERCHYCFSSGYRLIVPTLLLGAVLMLALLL